MSLRHQAAPSCRPGTRALLNRAITHRPSSRHSRTPKAALVGDIATMTTTDAQAPAAAKVAGRTVVITGGSQGVGRALALLFAGKGWNVVLAARSEGPLQATAQDVEKLLGSVDRVLAVPIDIGAEADVDHLAEAVAARFASLDLVINNAGVCCTGAVADTPTSELSRMMNTNFLGAALVTRALLPQLLAAAEAARAPGAAAAAAASGLPAGPAVLMVNSFAARIPLKNMGAYTASKYALQGWTDVLAAELAPQGVFVGTVHPGVIASAFLERAAWYGEAGKRAQAQMGHMLGGGGGGMVQTPQQVADTVWASLSKRRRETTVGALFKAAISAYQTTGFNLFSAQQ